MTGWGLRPSASPSETSSKPYTPHRHGYGYFHFLGDIHDNLDDIDDETDQKGVDYINNRIGDPLRL